VEFDISIKKHLDQTYREKVIRSSAAVNMLAR